MAITKTPMAWVLTATSFWWALPAIAAEAEKYFPAETQAVVTVNVRQILGSALLQSQLDRIRRELNRNTRVRETLGSLGFDPLKDLDGLYLAGASVRSAEKAVLVLTGRFDVARFRAKAEEVAKTKDGLLRIHVERGQTIYETNLPGQSKPLFATVLDQTTIVASFDKSYVVDSLDVQTGKKRPALREEMRQLLGKVPPGQSIALAGLGAALMEGLTEPDRVRHLIGGIRIGDDIRTEFTIQAKDPAAATDLARLLREALDQGKNFLTLIAMSQPDLAPLIGVIDTLKVTSESSDVDLRGVVTRKYLDELKRQR
jgi:hypothetical protein